MGNLKSKAYIIVILVLIITCQTVYGQNTYFDTKYSDGQAKNAYAMEDKYITEEVRFSVPFVLTKYNVTRSGEGGFLFVSLRNNKINCVYYNSKGNIVFGDPLNIDNYVNIKSLEGQNISLIANRYNLSSLGEYDINSITVTEDDEYFYIPLKTEGDKYTISQIRISKELGTVDEGYLQSIYEIDSDLCYSFNAVQAIDDEGNSSFVINIDRNIIEAENNVGRLHEIYVVNDACKLVFSEEILYSVLEKGHLLRNTSISHQAVLVNGILYFVEGVKYEKYVDNGYLYECILYSLGETTKKISINEIADSSHFIENGEYYSVHILPVNEGLGCIFNYCDIKYEQNNMYTYYSAVASFSYTGLNTQYIKYYTESEIIETTEGEKVKYIDYVDLLNLEGEMAIITEIREPSDDVIFQGKMLDVNIINIDKEGNEARKLITRNGLHNAEIKYGSTNIEDKLYIFDNIPEYDKYTEILPDDTVISFVSMEYGVAYTAEGFDDLTVYINTPINVLQGVSIKDYLSEQVVDLYAQYNNGLLENGMFLIENAGVYDITIACTDNEGRIFNLIRRVNVTNPSPKTEPNPQTDDLYRPILILISIAMLLTLFERSYRHINVN